jgi:hypothetical protein
MKLHKLCIKVKLKTPYLVHGSDPGRLGVDAVLLRNHQGQRILPGTLIAGRVADAWKVMEEQFGIQNIPAPEEWFGAEAKKADDKTEPNAPQRARLFVDDLVCCSGDDDGLAVATRVAIEDSTGAAQTGALQMIEQGVAADTELVFEGQWRAWLDDNECEPLRQNLLAGILWHTQLGALRSVGFGEIVEAEVCVMPATMKHALPPLGIARRIRIRLSFDRPLCVSTKIISGNIFVSDDILSGGTIKGALAGMCVAANGKSWNESALGKAFARLRISHAFPSVDGMARPHPLPLSLVADEGGKIWDVAHCAKSALVNGKAPTFQTDWKNELWQEAAKIQKWGETSTHLRVRTAIDVETRQAKDKTLFAYECRVAKANTVWLADICLDEEMGEAEARSIWQALREALAYGLGSIGKTDAWATVEWQEEMPVVWPSSTETIGGNTFVVQLLTPALLFAPTEVANQSNPDLKQLYKNAFETLSDSALTLSHLFASQSMAGGEYLWHRFMKGKKNNKYLPYVLSDPGSVFVLRVAPGKEADAKNKVEKWLANGLPLPANVADYHGSTWRENPYLPQNGYGEVSVNIRHGFPILKSGG